MEFLHSCLDCGLAPLHKGASHNIKPLLCRFKTHFNSYTIRPVWSDCNCVRIDVECSARMEDEFLLQIHSSYELRSTRARSTVLTFASSSFAFQSIQQPRSVLESDAFASTRSRHCNPQHISWSATNGAQLYRLDFGHWIDGSTLKSEAPSGCDVFRRVLSPIIFLCYSSVSLLTAGVRMSARFCVVLTFCTVRCDGSDSLL